MIDAIAYLRCQDLIYRLWNALDHRRLDDVMSRLTPDARWQRERWYEGEADIRAALNARPADLRIRHALTNLIVDAEGDGYRTRFLMVPQMAMASAGQDAPFEAEPMATVADMIVRIVRRDEEWLVSEIAFDAVFQAKAR
nr:nuclear transport factor 2 family protein [Sphingomonas sp. CDS-1]